MQVVDDEGMSVVDAAIPEVIRLRDLRMTIGGAGPDWGGAAANS
jgi:hypothetical protein